MINAREAPLTDRAAKVLLGGLHVGPSGRKGGSGVNASVKSKRKSGGERRRKLTSERGVRSGGGGIAGVFVPVVPSGYSAELSP